MLGLRSLLFLAFRLGAAADATGDANAATIIAQYMAGKTSVSPKEQQKDEEDAKGSVTSGAMDPFMSYFAQRLKTCSFAEGPLAYFLKDVTPTECLTRMAPATFIGTKYKFANQRIGKLAANGTSGFALWHADFCGMGPDGNCVPGSTITLNDVAMYTFDDQHKIDGFDDWWQPGTMERVDLLVKQSESKLAMATSNDPALFPSTSGYKSAMVGALVTCLLLCALAKGFFELGKREGHADYARKYSALLQE